MKRMICAVALLASAGCVATNLFAPDGATSDAAGFIYFSSNREGNNYELYRMPASGGTPVRLTTDAEHNDYSPMPSRDGKLVAWVREVAKAGEGVTSTEIWVMNADGSNPRAVVQNGASNTSPSWIAGDTALVFASDVGGDWEIYRVSLSGGASPRDLTNNPYADQAPRVSPDGQRIVFQSNRTLDFEIYTMAIDGSDVRNVSQDPADDRFPTWSADGTRILWNRYADSFNIWTMNADGSDQRVVLAGSFSDTSPAVAPDGSAMVFTSDRAAPSSLFVYPLAGGAVRQVTNLAGWLSGTDLDPVWVK